MRFLHIAFSNGFTLIFQSHFDDVDFSGICKREIDYPLIQLKKFQFCVPNF
jgi:hypothetical protein